MLTTEFNKVVEARCKIIKQTLQSKQAEYNFTTDRLDSFKKAGILENISPIAALEGYLTKHVISLYDMMNSDTKFSKARWEEKIGDAINYLILLEALLQDLDLYKEVEVK